MVIRTCIRPFVKFACDPLYRDLLEEEDSRRQHESEQELRHRVSRSLRGLVVRLLPAIDEGVE